MEKEREIPETERAAEFEEILEAESQRLSAREAILTLETKLRIEAARVEIEELKEDYPKNQERIKELEDRIKKLSEERLGVETEIERAAEGIAVEVQGFTEEIRKVVQKPEVKQAIKDLEEAEEEKEKSKIEERRKALLKYTAEMPWLDDNEVKILLSRLVPPYFQKFFEQYCRIIYDPNATSDTISPPAREGDKITFTFGPKAIFEKLDHIKLERIEIEEEPVAVIKPERLAFQIGRMLGALLTEPSNWNRVARQIEIEKGKCPSWEDFVGLCLTSPQDARDLSEPAYEHFVKCLQELSELSAEEIKERFKEKKTFDKVGELAPGTKKEGMVSKIARFPLRLAANTIGTFFRRILAIYEEKQIWYDMAISQLEIEEAKLITTRQEHISDRDKRLWIYLLGGDKLGARGLILSDATTGDSRWWRYHLYLYMFDPLYRATKGNEITWESYAFLVRCTRTSHAMHRSGSKPGEYVSTVENGRKVYRRISRKDWLNAAAGEVNKHTTRTLMNTTEETFDWMQHEGRFFELDETFGGKKPEFFEGDEEAWKREETAFETNYLEKINLPDWLIEKIRGIHKLDADQLAVCARIIAAHELSEEAEEEGLIGKIVRAPLRGNEHARTIQKDMVGFYQERVRRYLDWRKTHPNQRIEEYEQFIRLVNEFKKHELKSYVKEIKEVGNKKDLEILRNLGLLRE